MAAAKRFAAHLIVVAVAAIVAVVLAVVGVVVVIAQTEEAVW